MLSNLSGIEIFYLICAILGGVFVFVRIIMMVVGMDHDAGQGDLDVGGHDIGHDAGSSHTDSDSGFKALSIHSLSSFFMMFGLVGLALYRQSRAGLFLSLAGAVAAGFGAVWVIGKLFSMVAKLQSSGTIDINRAVGAQGKVYLRIPENGTGRVLVTVSNSLREYDAQSNDGKEIVSDTPIRVVWVDGNVLVVEKIVTS
jgi:membrane protein implicated in regulation of membrane protease activity